LNHSVREGHGIAGVLLLLCTAIIRLSVPAIAAFDQSLNAMQWGFLIASIVFMAYFEGLRGFQRSWSPRVVSRALWLRQHWTITRVIFAPLFCMGFFHTTRRRMIVAWCLSAGIIALVLLVGRLPQPWRGLLDVGVIVGLAWGVTSVILIFCATLLGRRISVDPQVTSASLDQREANR